MSAQGSLSKYQLGKYLFTKEKIEQGGLWEDTPQTSYKMYRDPNAEESAEEPGWAPARDVGTLTVAHHPPLGVPVQATRRVVGNAAAMAARNTPEAIESRLRGSERGGRVVHSKDWHEKYSPTDEVELMTVEKGSRTMVPTLLALGQRAAKETTGRDLQASRSLSTHSQRLVDRFKESGMVPESHVSERNQISFMPALPVGPPGGLEGLFSAMRGARERFKSSVEMEEPIPRPDIERAKTEGREMVRSLRPGYAPKAPAPGAARPQSRREQLRGVPRHIRDA